MTQRLLALISAFQMKMMNIKMLVCLFVVSLALAVSVCLSLSLSVLTAIFPGEPRLAGFIEAKDDGSGSNNWSCNTYKAPLK